MAPLDEDVTVAEAVDWFDQRYPDPRPGRSIFDAYGIDTINRFRAGRGARGAADYYGPAGAGQPLEQAIRDLFTDLRHCADVIGVDADDLWWQATAGYRDELTSEGHLASTEGA